MAVVLVPIRHSNHILLIQRPVTMAEHAGQIACPGGRFDPLYDKTLCDTACRETQEEVGVQLNASYHVDTLSPVYIPPTGYTILPHVFCLSTLPPLILSREAEQAHWVSLEDLRRALDTSGGYSRYPLPWGTVWGATARIIDELLNTPWGKGMI